MPILRTYRVRHKHRCGLTGNARCLFATAALLAILVTAGCATVPTQRLRQHAGYRDAALDGQGITLMSWNIKKGAASGWPMRRDDANRRARLTGADLLLFQEACGDATGLAPSLDAGGYGWAFAVSFESATLGCGGDIATGVLTASRAEPLITTPLRSRHREFGITPKTALATTYAIRGSDEHLLVINAHLLNFELIGADAFAAQLDRIGQLIAAHHGPVIFAGDLNTRNQERSGRIAKLALRYHLKSVFGPGPDRRDHAWFGGQLPLDHIFYRGLSVIKPGRIGHEAEQGYSDHNSLTVTFALSGVNDGHDPPGG